MSNFPFEHINERGYYSKGIFDILNTIVTNFNAMLSKVDTDTGDTDFNGSYAVTDPSIGTTFGKDIQPNALPQGKVNELLYNLRTNLNDALDAFAADDGIDGTTIYTAKKFAATANLVEASNARIKYLGEHQDAISSLLDAFIEQFNGVLLALDQDATLDDTDYASTYFLTDYVEESSSSSSSRSSSCSSLSSSSSSSYSSSSSSSSSLSSSSSSSRSSSSSSLSSSSSSSLSSSSSSSSRSSSSSSRSSSSSSSSSRSSSSSSSSSSNSSSSSSSSSQSVS